jgi:CCR4-NOT transcription complex subunit 2
MGVYGRPAGGNDDPPPFNVNAPFSQDEFPALGGMNDVHSQRQGLAQHLAGQSNGVYDPRQQGQPIMTPPPNLSGSQSLQQAQDHRASMLEALQQGQRAPPRTGVSPNALAGIPTGHHDVTAGSSVKDNRNSLQNYLGDEQKLGSDAGGFSNTTGLSGEELNAAADAAQSLPTNSNQNEYNSQELDTSKREESDADVWGIKGLLGIIKVEDSDKSKLALGVDLTSLGLNMNQPE